MNITQDSIMCGCMDGNCYGNNIVITLVCFFIYKDWLVRSLDNKKRSVDFNLELFKCELKLRMDIYKKCNMIVHVNQIVNLLSSYYNSSNACGCVCLFVCSLSPPRSFDGSSTNLVSVCRLTSQLQ